MKRKTQILFILLIFIILSTPVSFANENPSVAVLSFEEGRVAFSWNYINKTDFLEGITQQITDTLINVDDIRVIERSRIKEVLTEQDFGLTGRVDQASAAEIGQILGVDALILGTLTQLNVKEKGSISLGPLTVEGLEADIGLSARIVDSTTAEILASIEGYGEASETGFSLSDFEGISFHSDAFGDSALGKSIDRAIDDLIEDLDVDLLQYDPGPALEGTIVEIIDSQRVIVDIGSSDGLRADDKGALIRFVGADTLDEPIKMTIGEVEIFSLDDSGAVLEVIQTEDPLEVGMAVEF